MLNHEDHEGTWYASSDDYGAYRVRHQVMDMGAYEFAFQFLVAISSHNNNAKLLSAFDSLVFFWWPMHQQLVQWNNIWLCMYVSYHKTNLEV